MKTVFFFLFITSLLIARAQKPWDAVANIVNYYPMEKCFSDISGYLGMEDYKKSYDKAGDVFHVLDKFSEKPVNLIAIESPKFDSLKSFFEKNSVDELIYQYNHDTPIKKYTFQPHKYSFHAKYFKVYDAFVFSDVDPSKRGFHVYDTVWYEEEYSPSSEVKTNLQPEDFAFHPFRVFTELEKDRLKKEFDTAIFHPDGTINLLGKFNSPDRFKSRKEFEAYEKNYMDSIHRLTESKLYFREFFLRKQKFTEEELDDIWKHLKKIKSPPLSYSSDRTVYLKTIRITRLENYTRVSCKMFRIKGTAEIISLENYYFNPENEWVGFSDYEYYNGKSLSDSVVIYRNDHEKISRLEHFYVKSYYEPCYLHITLFDYHENLQLKKVSVCGMPASKDYSLNKYSCANEVKCIPEKEYLYDTSGNLIEKKVLQNVRKISYTPFNRPEKMDIYSTTHDSLELIKSFQFIYDDTLLHKVQVINVENLFKHCQITPEDNCYFQMDDKGGVASYDLFTLFYNDHKKPERMLKTTTRVYTTRETSFLSMEKSEYSFTYDKNGWQQIKNGRWPDILYFTYK